MKRTAALALLVALAGCGGTNTTMRSDWENQNAAQLAKESESAALPRPPRYPAPGDLVEFRVDGFAGYRLFVDPASLSVGDETVRYTLVARSTAGAENVSYEALNCRSAEMRLLASGRSDGTWVLQQSPWRPVGTRPVQRALLRDYFCAHRIAIANAEEGAMALRRGGHPRTEQQNPVSGSGR
ncbi:MAG TPA: CNP1-like family protein [Burkholderiales bacterium]|nr:CNP1-like family protein [Burkholderiales bacterium]